MGDIAGIPLPVLLALGTAVFFATSTVLIRVGVQASPPVVALFVSLTVNVVVLWAISAIWYDVVVDLWAWRYFIVGGLFAPALGRFANYVGIQRVGVNLSVPISSSSPLVSVLLAIPLLGERLPILGYGAILAVIGGGVLLASVRADGSASDDFERSDLLFPVFGAICFGVVQLFRKVGVELVTAPAVGAAVNISTSWLVVAAYLLYSGRLVEIRVPSDDLWAFVLAGIASSIGLVLLYASFAIGKVVMVTPILNTMPLFAILLSFLFIRNLELFSRRVLVGTAFVVTGVAVLSAVT